MKLAVLGALFASALLWGRGYEPAFTSASASSTMPPCEASPPPASTPKAPTAPKNLQIIKGLVASIFGGEEEFRSGPSADESEDVEVAAVQSSGTHNYYNMLASRSDCVGAFSLRNQDQVLQYRRQPSLGLAGSVNYIYPNDPDPRKQDAAKVVIPADKVSLPNQVWLPIPAHDPENLLIVWDVWWGKEFAFENTAVSQYKAFWLDSPGGQIWNGFMSKHQLAETHTHNLPPGGPYVAMLSYNVHDFMIGAGSTVGVPGARLPYGAPGPETRNYGSEALGPYATNVRPQGMEFGTVAERWTRHWVFFERARELDWESTSTKFPGTMRAYKMSQWAADENREPVLIHHERVVAPNPGHEGGWDRWRIEMNSSAPQAAIDRMNDGRGPLVQYVRNIVMLRGTPKGTVVSLLQRPVK